MAFLTAVASSRFPSTNNQLRTSSNERNQATIQDGRVLVKKVQRRQGQSYSGTCVGIKSLLDTVGITAAQVFVNTAVMKLQKLVSQLELLNEKLSQENVNQKLLRIPPPYTGNFMPPTSDLSFTGLDDFVNKHVVEKCKAKSSEEEPK
nr:hypothetical protein [Tanacetum cinerariifolium]